MWLAIRENPDTRNLEHLSSGKIEVPSLTTWNTLNKYGNCVHYHYGGSEGLQYAGCTSNSFNFICEIVLA